MWGRAEHRATTKEHLENVLENVIKEITLHPTTACAQVLKGKLEPRDAVSVTTAVPEWREEGCLLLPGLCVPGPETRLSLQREQKAKKKVSA